MHDYYENNDCWNNEKDVFQNSVMNDSESYGSNVYLNNGMNELLSLLQNPPILNNETAPLG